MSIPLIRNYINRIEIYIKQFGLQEGMRQLASKYNAKLETIGLNKETKMILEKKPVVIAANHPYELETIGLIAALPKREDSFLIINSGVLGIIPALDKYLIPVYIQHHTPKNRLIGKKLSGIFVNLLNNVPQIQFGEAHRRNIQSITEASSKVQNGGLVIIYPQSNRKNGEWLSGIGHLIKGIKNKNAFYFQAYISGTSLWDYFRLIPFFGKLFPPIKVIFDKPIKLENIKEKDGKKIMYMLEEKYRVWVANLAVNKN